MFVIDLTMSKLVVRDIIHFDGTFKVVPYNFRFLPSLYNIKNMLYQYYIY